MEMANRKSDRKLGDESEIEVIYHYFSLLWKKAWLIVLAGAILAATAFLITMRLPRVYQTSTTLLILNVPANDVQDYGSIQASQILTGTYSDLLTDESILNDVISRLGLQTNPSELAKTIIVTPVRSSQRIVISVENTDAAKAATIANTLVTVFTEKLGKIQDTQVTGSKLNVVQISPAGLSFEVVSPNIPLIPLLAGLFGVLLASAFVITKDELDKSLKTPEEVAEKLNLPVVGVIYKHKAKGDPIIHAHPNARAAESFRYLAAKVMYAANFGPIRSILITSPTKSEGKTTVSANLAIAISQLANCVTLIDADVKHASIDKKLKLTNSVGLSDLLVQGQSGLTKQGMMQTGENEKLSVISSGSKLMEMRNLLVYKKFDAILDELARNDQIVVIDSAPVLQMSETLMLSTKVDCALLVIQAGKTTLSEAREAVENLQWVNAKIIGIVLNKV